MMPLFCHQIRNQESDAQYAIRARRHRKGPISALADVSETHHCPRIFPAQLIDKARPIQRNQLLIVLPNKHLM
jgi:hypothetical protein